ncbi:FkbM family methyltransferase [Nocardia wallacei]|uniref:FkbM family methyltransferase n=1 Tax=Nocardia wallacei TaxID=480035 RepID=UPI00245850C4|nr:FkbM family methyltransferase [Nocardia wallacei]
MIVLTPDQRYRFTTRDGSPSDESVIRETWVENVYQIHAGDLTETRVFIDIGANIGAVSVYAASLGARVIAVEPEPENLHYLFRNLTGNDVDDAVRVHQLAVSAARGRASITASHGNSRLDPAGLGFDVETITLADVFTLNGLDSCDVVKIDIEGSERDVIAGATLDTLRRIRYLTMEFDRADDAEFGPMITKLAKVFNLHVIGSPERGGYIYGRRY